MYLETAIRSGVMRPVCVPYVAWLTDPTVLTNYGHPYGPFVLVKCHHHFYRKFAFPLVGLLTNCPLTNCFVFFIKPSKLQILNTNNPLKAKSIIFRKNTPSTRNNPYTNNTNDVCAITLDVRHSCSHVVYSFQDPDHGADP